MVPQTHHKLIVWQEAHKFALAVYRASDAFPKHELYGITSQLRRAATSVPTNIVEGYARQSSKECLRFFNIGDGSLAESGYLVELARDLGYLDELSADKLLQQRSKVGYLLHRFQTASLPSL